MSEPSINRRDFGKAGGLALAATALPALGEAADDKPRLKSRILKSIKFGMFNEKISIAEKFKLLKEIGYDGVELNSPGGEDKKEALAASRETGLPIHGIVDRSEEHTSELQSRRNLVCRLLPEKKKYIDSLTFLSNYTH